MFNRKKKLPPALTVWALGSLGMLAACDAVKELTIEEASYVSSEYASKASVKEHDCRCEDLDGKVVWKFSIKEKDLDGKELHLELSKGDKKIIEKAIRKFLGYKFDRSDLTIETKEFRNRLAVTITLYGVEIPEGKEPLVLRFKIDGKVYEVKSKEYELVNGKWRRETRRNDEGTCQ